MQRAIMVKFCVGSIDACRKEEQTRMLLRQASSTTEARQFFVDVLTRAAACDRRPQG